MNMRAARLVDIDLRVLFEMFPHMFDLVTKEPLANSRTGETSSSGPESTIISIQKSSRGVRTK